MSVLPWICFVRNVIYCGLSIYALCNIKNIVNYIDSHANRLERRFEVFAELILLLNVMNLFFSPLISMGVNRMNRFLVFPWLVGGFLSIFFSLFIIFTFFIFSTGASMWILIGALIAVLFDSILWYVVYRCLFRDMHMMSRPGYIEINEEIDQQLPTGPW